MKNKNLNNSQVTLLNSNLLGRTWLELGYNCKVSFGGNPSKTPIYFM